MTTIDHLAHRALSFRLGERLSLSDSLTDCVVDAIGCALAGVGHARFGALLALAPAIPEGIPLIGTTRRTEPSFACMVNGFAIHALDFDDDSYVGLLHPTTTVLPAVLAAVANNCVDGQTFLTALGAGIDAQCVASLVWSDAAYDRGWWNTALLGGIGAAVATGRLLGLGPDQMKHAMAAALANAHGLKCSFGSDQKPLGVGLAARAGYEAAILARAGFTAPLDIFESADGFLGARGLISEGPPPRDAIETAISPIQVPGIAFKPWPVCNAGHAAIEATLTLRTAHNLEPDDVSHVVVEVLPFVRKCLQYDRPSSPAQAQFSLPFAVAAAILGPGPTLDDLEPGMFDRGELLALIDRVNIVVCDSVEDFADEPARREGARVSIKTTDGRCLSTSISIALGQTARPLGSKQIDIKFLRNAVRALSQTSAEKLLGSLRSLAGAPDVRSVLSSTMSADIP